MSAFPIWTPRLGKIYSGLRHTRSTWFLVLARLGFIGTAALHELFFPFRSVYLPRGEGVLQASPVIYLYPFIFLRLHTSLRILSPHSKARRVVIDDSHSRGLYELAGSQVSHLGFLSLSLLLSPFISQRITAFASHYIGRGLRSKLLYIQPVHDILSASRCFGFSHVCNHESTTLKRRPGSVSGRRLWFSPYPRGHFGHHHDYSPKGFGH